MSGTIKTMSFMEAVDYKKHNHERDVRRYGKNWQLGMDMVRYFDHHDESGTLSFEDIEAIDWVYVRDNLVEVQTKKVN